MPYSVGATVGASTGSSIERRRLSAKMVSIAGTDEVYTSDSYSAATNAVADPTDLIYLHVCSRHTLGTSTAQGLGYVIRGTLSVKYYEHTTVGN